MEGPITHKNSATVENAENKKNQSIEEFLKQSGLEHVPHIETKFYFHTHVGRHRGEEIARLLKEDNIDIFAPEGNGWSENTDYYFNKFLQGEISPEQRDKERLAAGMTSLKEDQYNWAVFNGMYNLKKNVIFMDLPEGHELQPKIDDASEASALFEINDLESLNFDELLKKGFKIQQTHASAQKEREDYMLKSFYDSLLKKLKEKPELQNKKELKILVTMGAFHTRLFHEMKKMGNSVTREFDDEMPYRYHTHEGIQRQINLKGPDSAEQYMPKKILSSILFWINRDVPIELLQKAMKTFSNQQIKELLEMYQKRDSLEQFKKEARAWIVSQLITSV